MLAGFLEESNFGKWEQMEHLQYFDFGNFFNARN